MALGSQDVKAPEGLFLTGTLEAKLVYGLSQQELCSDPLSSIISRQFIGNISGSHSWLKA